MIEIKSNLYNVAIDPTSHFKNVPVERVAEACGVIPTWVIEWCYHKKDPKRDDLPTLKDFLDQRYGFGLSEFTGSKIESTGKYLSAFAEDPALYPLVSVDTKGFGILYQYQSSIVAIPLPEGGHFVTRMD